MKEKAIAPLQPLNPPLATPRHNLGLAEPTAFNGRIYRFLRQKISIERWPKSRALIQRRVYAAVKLCTYTVIG